MRHPLRARRRSLFLIGALAGAAFLGGSALLSRSQTPQSDTTREVAPGLTLRCVVAQTPQGPLRFWLVKAAPDAFDLGLEIPDASNAQKKRSVRALAAQSGALVAINGGFFAYGGAAVGAVKRNGAWQRLPWKSRTALAWNSSQDAQIGPLSGKCEISYGNADGNSTLVFRDEASLNGWTLPGSRTGITDGFAVMTPEFGPKYTLKPGESGILVRQNLVAQRGLAGEVALPADGFLLLARGAARDSLDGPHLKPQVGAGVYFSISTAPPEVDNFGNILGAGPRLVEQGQIKTNEIEEEFRPDVLARGPRTCVGWDAQHNWLLLVADGRSTASVGLTIPETAALFQQLGAVEAMNLDGGSSTQLVVKGELINTPSGVDPANPTRPREVQVINALTLKAHH